MTRSSLVARLSERFPHLMARDTELAVRLILDAISDALAESSRVEVRGFGSFALSYRPPASGGTRSPVTRWSFRRSMCRISKRAKNYANAWINCRR